MCFGHRFLGHLLTYGLKFGEPSGDVTLQLPDNHGLTAFRVCSTVLKTACKNGELLKQVSILKRYISCANDIQYMFISFLRCFPTKLRAIGF